MDRRIIMTDLDPSPWLKEVGTATTLTRGDSYLWPWYETAAPPFNRMCPICYELDELEEAPAP